MRSQRGAEVYLITKFDEQNNTKKFKTISAVPWGIAEKIAKDEVIESMSHIAQIPFTL